VKSLNILIEALMRDAERWCRADLSRDVIEVARRDDQEGYGFYTHALTAYHKTFISGLRDGSIASATWPGFRVRRGFPLFLGGLLRQIFAPDGTVLSDASTDAIYFVRQITAVASKVFQVCEDRYTQESLRAYETCENDLREAWYDPRLLRDLRLVATRLFGEKLARIERVCSGADFIPRHGPGATADRLVGNEKYDLREWPSELGECFTPGDVLSASYTRLERRLSMVIESEPGQGRPVRVTPVPKSATKARIIAIEPSATQYCQQAVLRLFAQEFSGQESVVVSLDDQSRNRRLAKRGSEDGSLVTIDLSEASDRVSTDVVNAVFGDYPHLRGALFCTRTASAELPDGHVIRLRKFASMGSATCFPVESIVFATIAATAILGARYRDRARTHSGYWRNHLSVFGDDIIAPRRYAREVLDVLCRCGARPNSQKTFLSGGMRESCGGDYWRGEDITPVYVRQPLPGSRTDVRSVVSTVALRNLLYWRGCWAAANVLDELLRGIIPWNIVESTSPGLGRESVLPYRVHRHHPDYQSPLVRAAVVRAPSPRSTLSGDGALLKCLLPGRDEPFQDSRHLTHSGRPQSVYIKTGWVAPF